MKSVASTPSVSTSLSKTILHTQIHIPLFTVYLKNHLRRDVVGDFCFFLSYVLTSCVYFPTRPMATINVYKCYFEAQCTFAGVPRRAAQVCLVADSENGLIKYTLLVNFFPHTAPDDFTISYDALAQQTLYEASGRRSRKREETLLQSLQNSANLLVDTLSATIYWDKPLIEPQRA